MTSAHPVPGLMIRLVAFLLLVGIGGCRSAAPAAGPEFFEAADPAMRSLPFSEAVRVGNVLYLSGHVGALPGTLDLAPGGIEAETVQTFENIRTVLERHGSSLDQVFQCTVYLADIAEWPVFNEVYGRVFSAPYPARNALAATALPLGARTEVTCMAYVAE